MKLISLNVANSINCTVAHVKYVYYIAASFAFKKSYMVLALKATYFNGQKKKNNFTTSTERQEILFFLTVFWLALVLWHLLMCHVISTVWGLFLVAIITGVPSSQYSSVILSRFSSSLFVLFSFFQFILIHANKTPQKFLYESGNIISKKV